MMKKLILGFLLVAGFSYGATEEKASDDARRRIPVSPEIPIKPRGDFEDLKKRPGGATFSSSFFRETSTGHIWIGKSPTHVTDEGVVEKAMTESNVCREKIASDIYAYYGVAAPKIVLSNQLTTKTGIPEYDGHEVMHIMSKRIDGYHDYKTQVGFTTFQATLHPIYGAIVSHSDACDIGACIGSTKEGFFSAYRTEGLGRIAAVATWLHDIDCIGGSASNIGYRIVQRGGQRVAEIVLVDPGESFMDPGTLPYPDPRHIRFATMGDRLDDHTISFETLCPPDSLSRREFIETLRYIVETDRRTILSFFNRRNAEYFISRDPRSVEGLTQQLMDRKETLAKDYAAELSATPIDRIVARKRIAVDMYARYGINALQIDPAYRMMDGYHDYNAQEGFTTFQETLHPTYGAIVSHKDACAVAGCTGSKRGGYYSAYKTKGLGGIAAVATWLHDVDFIGERSSNVGYQTIRQGLEIIAKASLVGIGSPFTDPRTVPYPDPRHIQLVQGEAIPYDVLCPTNSLAQGEFIDTLHRIIGTDERTIARFFMDHEYFESGDERTVSELTRQLMERKEALARDYAPELTSIPPVPLVARGHVEAYRQFLNGVLVYKPNKENDRGKIELPIRALANPLEGTFDLSRCGDTGQYISIHTGYKKAKIPDNANKVEIWFMPKFLVEANIGGDARWLRGVMSSFDAPYGIVWTWGGYDVKSDNFDYLLSGEILMDKSKNLYAKWLSEALSHTLFGSAIVEAADVLFLEFN